MAHRRYSLGHPSRRLSALGRPLALLAVVAALASGPAWSAGPDELAQTIEQHLSSIEFRLSVTPERAVHDLDEQKRRLQMLESEAPDHPMVPELTRRIEQLEDELAERLAEDPAQQPGAPAAASGALGPSEASSEVADRLQEVERRIAEAEAGLLQGRAEDAAEQLSRADEMIAEIESEHADQIPAGHVPLFVAKERVAALRDQLNVGR